MGISGRKLGERAEQQAYFIQAVNALCDGSLVPVAGGVLVRDSTGAIIGAVGVTGDTSDHDEELAIAAIEAQGLQADVGGHSARQRLVRLRPKALPLGPLLDQRADRLRDWS